MNNLIKEAVHFNECTQVTLLNIKNPNFDIIETDSITMDGYCQALIDKVFLISHSEIADFIKHHLHYVQDKIHWINKFEKLVSVNEFLFKKDRNKTRLMKIYTSTESVRICLVKTHFFTNENKPPARFINAESEDRYFSFHKTLKDLDLEIDFRDKIIFLTNEIFEYEQANIDFINPKLTNYGEQCQKKINQLEHIRKLTEELNPMKNESQPFNKLQFNGNVNQLVDVFYQLSRELFIDGRSYLDGSTSEIAKIIVNSFVDKEGNELNIETVKTILTPSKSEKRPSGDKRIDVEKIVNRSLYKR